jgi:hypothetical protein
VKVQQLVGIILMLEELDLILDITINMNLQHNKEVRVHNNKEVMVHHKEKIMVLQQQEEVINHRKDNLMKEILILLDMALLMMRRIIHQLEKKVTMMKMANGLRAIVVVFRKKLTNLSLYKVKKNK